MERGIYDVRVDTNASAEPVDSGLLASLMSEVVLTDEIGRRHPLEEHPRSQFVLLKMVEEVDHFCGVYDHGCERHVTFRSEVIPGSNGVTERRRPGKSFPSGQMDELEPVVGEICDHPVARGCG